jgi:hypothetical protein
VGAARDHVLASGLVPPPLPRLTLAHWRGHFFNQALWAAVADNQLGKHFNIKMDSI